MKPLWLSFLASFGMNWLWEKAQMPAYQEMAGKSWSESLELCTIAAQGDVLLTLLSTG